jgi:hypothetical protein
MSLLARRPSLVRLPAGRADPLLAAAIVDAATTTTPPGVAGVQAQAEEAR